ncbi:hypothetical protein F4604DRAFT_1995545 [Suillus subluteus]|nr:hypothetical protein F4604DRAFT_1995545 [Suillus subluteus]
MAPADDDEDNDDFYFNDDIDYDDDYSEDYTDTDGNSKWHRLQRPCGFHACHWSSKFNDVHISLRDLILSGTYLKRMERTGTTFAKSSSPHSCVSPLAAPTILPQPYMCVAFTCIEIIIPIAYSPATLTFCVSAMRPHTSLQPSYLNALHIVEKELLDTAHHPHHRTTELTEIMAFVAYKRNCPSDGTGGAHDGVSSTPGMEGAMDDADPLGYVDIDIYDPDLDGLRDYFRPNLKTHLEG